MSFGEDQIIGGGTGGGGEGPGTPGANGNNGWSPMWVVVVDGERLVEQLSDWIGGTGAKPGNIGKFKGAGVYVTSINDAIDYRGPAGADGQDGIDGQDGADSTVPGPQGPAGADSTVPGPQGPAGADSTVPGPQGPAGADSTVPGPAGPRGTNISSVEDPTQLPDPHVGDLNIHPTTKVVTRYIGTWIAFTSLVGSDGAAGIGWLHGSGVPTGAAPYGTMFVDAISGLSYAYQKNGVENGAAGAISADAWVPVVFMRSRYLIGFAAPTTITAVGPSGHGAQAGDTFLNAISGDLHQYFNAKVAGPLTSPLTYIGPPAVVGAVGKAYASAVRFSGGVAPFAWTLTSGTLPSGVTLAAATGILSGTPTTIQTRTGIVLTCIDAAGQNFATPAFQIAIAATGSAVPLNVSFYSASVLLTESNSVLLQVKAGGGSGTGYTYALASGSPPFPAGLSLGGGTTGLVTGSPTVGAAGIYAGIRIQATDSLGAVAYVVLPPLIVSPAVAMWAMVSNIKGPAGAAGAAGNTLLNGSGAPAAGVGNNGDYYVDNDTHLFYGPKAAGAWPAAFPPNIGVDIQTFNASGTWTKPAGALTVLAEVTAPGGGGQGGGSGSSAGYPSLGGHGGERRSGAFSAAELTATVSVLIGAGGAGGPSGGTGNPSTPQNGSNGGNSSFGSYLNALGGFGGGNLPAAYVTVAGAIAAGGSTPHNFYYLANANSGGVHAVVGGNNGAAPAQYHGRNGGFTAGGGCGAPSVAGSFSGNGGSPTGANAAAGSAYAIGAPATVPGGGGSGGGNNGTAGFTGGAGLLGGGGGGGGTGTSTGGSGGVGGTGLVRVVTTYAR